MKTKKLISILLAILAILSILSACTDTKNDSEPQKGDDNKETGYLEALPETDRLVLYRNADNSLMLDSAVNIFRRKYPYVDVEVRDFEGEEESYWTLLSAEIPAGKGPDLMLISYSPFMDIYKTLETDVFCDLDDFMGSDPDFDLGDYNEAALECGVYKGSRYFVPLSYRTKIILTTEEILASAGMELENLKSFDGYVREVKEYIEKHGDAKLVYDTQFQFMNMFFPWSGLRCLDYENRTVDVDGEEFKKVMEAYRDIYRQDWELAEQLRTTISERDIADALIGQKSVFGTITSWHNFAYTYGALAVSGQSPRFFRFPSANGEKVGQASIEAFVLNASPNKLNAYRLLKIMLSEEIQGNPQEVTIGGFPVLKSAIEIHSKYRIEDNLKRVYDGQAISISEEAMQEYVDMASDIDFCTIYTSQDSNIFYNTMMSYFMGADTYENCLGKLKNQMELYISE